METNNEGVKIVFFSSLTDEYQERIKRSALKLVRETQFLHCRTIHDLSNAVQKSLFGVSIFLIIVRDPEELDGILEFKERLKDHSIILIFRDTRDEMTQLSLSLYPRYMGYLQENHTDIVIVLKKMLSKIQNQNKGENQG